MSKPLFTFSILTAVSSDPQAREDKGSLEDQENFARKAGIEQGGIETAGPYVLDGYSRTGYINLTDALKDIPPLAQTVEDLEKNKYDVLIIDNLERLGSLAPMLYTLFGQKKKQIYSARQSGRIHDPNNYDPSSDESANIMMHVEGLIQGYRLNKLRRGLLLGIAKRMEQGKHSHAIPYGYVKTLSGELALDPVVSQLLITLKNKFLEGSSLRELAVIADASSVPPRVAKRWEPSSIRFILTNPFYTSKVFSNRWKMKDKGMGPNGKRFPRMKLNPNAKLYDGAHPALWSYDEHLRILTEMNERYKQHARYKTRVFSGLLRCSVCGHRLSFIYKKYRCHPLPDHIRILETDANEKIGRALADALRNVSDAPPEPPSPDVTAEAVGAIDNEITKVLRRLEKDIYTDEQAKEKIDNLRAQKAAMENTKEDTAKRIDAHARLLDIRDSVDLDRFPRDFAESDMRASNRFLRDILEYIEVTPKHEFRFHFR